MKWINFNASIAKAKHELQKACRERGFEPDALDLAESLEIKLIDLENIKLTYSTDKFEVCMNVAIENDRLTLNKPRFTKL